MSREDQIPNPEERYRIIHEDDLFDFIWGFQMLNELQAWGVDNWPGYEEAECPTEEAVTEAVEKYEEYEAEVDPGPWDYDTLEEKRGER